MNLDRVLYFSNFAKHIFYHVAESHRSQVQIPLGTIICHSDELGVIIKINQVFFIFNTGELSVTRKDLQ